MVLAAISVGAQNVIGRFDYDSLRASNVKCTYGLSSITAGTGQYNNGWSRTNSTQFMGPYATVGIIDNGQYAFEGIGQTGVSRHTVHTDTAQLDHKADSMYKCIPAGKTSSVRLGCARGSYYCQAIAYDIAVDTTISDMLVVQFAASLFNPRHNQDDMPRVLFEVLDNTGATLGKMDFTTLQSTANSTVTPLPLAWNSIQSNTYIHYLDWQKVGINLHQYHGQNITIRFTTFNCSQGALDHFAYAYYTVDYGNLALNTLPIVAKSNDVTFRAPDGFMTYKWVLDSDPTTVFDTAPTATIPADAAFTCQLTTTTATPRRCVRRQCRAVRRPISRTHLSATPTRRATTHCTLPTLPSLSTPKLALPCPTSRISTGL